VFKRSEWVPIQRRNPLKTMRIKSSQVLKAFAVKEPHKYSSEALWARRRNKGKPEE